MVSPLLLGAVERVGVERDWLDYVEVCVGGLAALAGIVALVVALRSAGAAGRSAKASEESAVASRAVAQHAAEQLEVVKQEAEAARVERSRRPKLRLSLAADLHPLKDASGDPVVVTVTMHNDGDRRAEDAELRVMVGDEIATIDSCSAAYGGDVTPMSQHEAFAAKREGGPFVNWTYVTEMHVLPAGVAVQRFFQVSVQQGFIPLSVRLFHADAPDGGATIRGVLNTRWDPSRPVLLDQVTAHRRRDPD